MDALRMFARGSLKKATLLVLALWVAPACAGSNPMETTAATDLPRAGEPEAAEQSCWRDGDCVLVDDCCGCSRGGLRMSVRGDRLNELIQRSAAVCEQRTCTEQPSQHRSCSATAARCAGGRCVPAL